MAGLELIGGVIARMRKARGWSCGQLAEMIGRSASWVAKIETGVLRLRDLEDLQPIADAFGMTWFGLIAAAEQDTDAPARLPKPAHALTIAVSFAAARAYDKPPSLCVDELSQRLGRAKQHLDDARPVDAAGVLAEVISELEHAAASTTAPAGDDGAARCTVLNSALTEAYQVAALALSHVGAHAPAQSGAEAAISLARASGNRPIAQALTAACAYRRGNHPERAAMMAEAVLRGVDAAELSVTATSRATRGAARLELAALAARAGEATSAHAHLAAAAEDAQAITANIELAGGTWFGPTMVAIRQLDVAIVVGDIDLALAIAARINTTDQPVMTRARARVYIAAAHGLAGNVDTGARIIAEITDMAPQLINDPVVGRLLRTFYRTRAEDRHQLTQLQPRTRIRGRAN